MGMSRTRIGGTVLLALVLVLAGCSGGSVDGTPTGNATAAGATTTTGATTAGATDTGTATRVDGSGGDDTETVDRQYVFDDGEAYGYVVDTENGTTRMSWRVTSTGDATPGPSEDVTVSVGFGRFGTNATAPQADIFAEVISNGSVGEPFLYVRTPVVLAAGHDLRVGNSWPVEDVTVGDGFDIDRSEARAEVTGMATVAGEPCYTMALRVPGDETGPTSCLKEDWPFALAVDTPDGDYRLVAFDRP